MPKPKIQNRQERASQQIQREMAELIRTELKDPRVGFVTITDLEVTRDYSHAKVFYTLMEGEDPETQKALERSSGFLRSQLGKRINMYSVPQLHFVYDHSVEHGMALSALIDKAAATIRPDGEDDQASDSAEESND